MAQSFGGGGSVNDHDMIFAEEYGDPAIDISNSINLAIAAAGTDGWIILPKGTFPILTTIAVNQRVRITGHGFGTKLQKNADVIGLEISTDRVILEDFRLMGSGADTTTGVKLSNAGRTCLRNIHVESCGAHGFELDSTSGNNNMARFYACKAAFNGGDGVHMEGGVDNNACLFSSLECKSNAGDGIKIVHGRDNVFIAPMLASNGGWGLELANTGGFNPNRNQFIGIYSEGNTSGSILVADDNIWNVCIPAFLGTIPSVGNRPLVLAGSDNTGQLYLDLPYIRSLTIGGDASGYCNLNWEDIASVGRALMLTRSGTSILADLDITTFGDGRGILVHSPNGTRYRISVDDSGNVIATAV